MYEFVVGDCKFSKFIINIFNSDGFCFYTEKIIIFA